MSLERILVPVESMRSTPKLLSVRSLLEMVALVPSSIKIPLLELPSTSFPAMVTSRACSRPIASSPESRTTFARGTWSRLDKADAHAVLIAYGTDFRDGGVAGSGNVYPHRLEAPDREARNAHIAHALVDLAGFGVEVAEDANSPSVRKPSSRASLPWLWRALRSRRRLRVALSRSCGLSRPLCELHGR